MNRKSIWFIVGLMSMALLGVVLMQSYWINYSIRLNEQQFNKNAHIALHEVSQKLMYREIKDFSRNFFFQDVPANAGMAFEDELFYQLKQDPSISVEYTFHGNIPEDSFLLMGKDIFYYKEKVDVSCLRPDDIPELYQHHVDQLWASFMSSDRSLLERINLNWLDHALTKELRNKGIDLDVSYGIYSNPRKNFVFVKSCEQPAEEAKVDQAGLHKLFDSPFKIELFTNDLYRSPGVLMIHFPGKASFIWQSVWGMVIGSILFTGIILFCFIYTVQVIFKQKKLSEIKTDFINNMTHEFKTPIATISLAADSINNPIISGDQQKVKRFASIIKEENKRMNSQVEKVLQMALLDKESFQLKIREVDIHEVIRKAARNVALQVEKKEGTIVLDLQATKSLVESDQLHLSNVIHNLLDNANKYSPQQPEITIRTKNVANGVQVTVADKGVGMNKEARKRIFDKFYRVHTGNLHDVKGFGLGLSYVKAIMTAHKGHIDVKSELGKGSEFFLFFPHKV